VEEIRIIGEGQVAGTRSCYGHADTSLERQWPTGRLERSWSSHFEEHHGYAHSAVRSFDGSGAIAPSRPMQPAKESATSTRTAERRWETSHAELP
jgi:hypothetical protein